MNERGTALLATLTIALILLPLGDLMRWPFYRLNIASRLLTLIDRTIIWDLGIDYGRASFTILLVLRKPADARIAHSK